ncbi:MAG: GTP cyclohydrolase II [bacterium]|nr:GTP cyclohydrolase II [bacterium]
MALPALRIPDLTATPCEGHPHVRIAATAKLPSRFGEFTIVAFESNDSKEHVAIIRGDVKNAGNVPVRLPSECLTGDVMGSLRCDCRDQLEAALKYISSQDKGIVLYLRQEGRGIGLVNKIHAYALQDSGLDTVEANHALGFRDDERDYAVAAEMLKALGVKSIHLLSNNPKKVSGLRAHGIDIRRRIPHLVPPNPHNRHYLETKARKSGHLISVSTFSLAAVED